MGASCDEVRCRNKKLGYDHPAAQTSMKGLMRTGRQDDQMAKKVEPSRHKPAGVGGKRLAEIKRNDVVTCVDFVFKNEASFAGCRQKLTDPITHTRGSCSEQCLIKSEIGGLAGTSSTRLTQLKSSTRNKLVSAKFAPPPRTSNILQHNAGLGVDQPPRGIRQFSGKGRSNVPIEHRDKQRCAPQTQEEIRENGGLQRQREISTATGKQYNPGGDGDTLPSATKRFLPCEVKASRAPELYAPRGCV